jgi:hypothetical protein
LGAQAGVVLVCNPEHARRRLLLQAARRPLPDVQAVLARFIATPPGTCWWERRPVEGRPGYRLVEDLASRDALVREKQRRDQARYRWLKERLLLAQSLAEMSPEELKGMRDRYPNLVAGLSPDMIRLASGYGPKELEQLFRGRSLNTAFSALSPGQQSLVRAGIGNQSYTVSRQLPDGASMPLRSYRGAQQYRGARLSVSPSGSPERPGISVFVWLTPEVAFANSNIIDPRLPRESERPQWLRDLLATQPEKKAPPRRTRPTAAALQQRVTVRRWVKTPAGQPGVGQPRVCFPADALQQIAAQTGLPIIADYDPGFRDYYRRDGFINLKEDLVNIPVWEALDIIEDTWGLTWTWKRDWLEVRSPRAIYALMGEVDLSPPWERNVPRDGH